MKILRETDYALRAVLHICREPEKLHLIAEMSERLAIPKSFLSKIMQKLVRAGMLSSVRGVKGGFHLVSASEDINVLRVIEAVQGPILVNSCLLADASCAKRKKCLAHPIWLELGDLLNARLSQYDMKSIMNGVYASSAELRSASACGCSSCGGEGGDSGGLCA